MEWVEVGWGKLEWSRMDLNGMRYTGVGLSDMEWNTEGRQEENLWMEIAGSRLAGLVSRSGVGWIGTE